MSDHDALMDQLRAAAAAADAPPEALDATAKSAFGLGRLEDELAELLHDTALQPTLTRGDDDGQPRLVSFAAEEVAADIQLTEGDDGILVTGMVSGPVSVAIVQTSDSAYDVSLDEHGRFRVGGVRGSVLRLELTTTSGYGVVTPWVRV